ncbi:2-oxo-4-hydroxy-4-carboxy-5-ureidoimidazoline decarboxylase [Roseofilum reptotaenium CS-1145]|uniref:2-oxo-4-hydroxy-4-carboxy-5-ureidoimidazoline decarboxylase n=1 Tax=Roseofilum reptotaenium AO1-A TaxID=1925591 RepID=A0A1L9QP77_9CYAN|nr:2-oxo-4-hydroxy-4-carboxy-5-ureidoimidazoline decarboxylase [Roseofilum reptotaenium]MDB9516445.1 2-oxo-4-hydroxy-4-carboxy-5-ureidoimidazoline decarboxylase [Roseofilum reptotaenium CS-1145]OJJ24442.1 OHCU decarboxylase [Roseofilum reptotaenium AO1-A]
MTYTIAQINQMSQEHFVEALGSVFEDTPTLAAQTWKKRPFRDTEHLHQSFISQMLELSDAEKMALIQAHPDLGSRVKMAPDSIAEQAGAGLDRLSRQQYDRFISLNQAYQDKFGFPFIMAVKGQTQDKILKAFEERLNYSRQAEREQALDEITKIVQFRLGDRVVN